MTLGEADDGSVAAAAGYLPFGTNGAPHVALFAPGGAPVMLGSTATPACTGTTNLVPRGVAYDPARQQLTVGGTNPSSSAPTLGACAIATSTGALYADKESQVTSSNLDVTDFVIKGTTFTLLVARGNGTQSYALESGDLVQSFTATAPTNAFTGQTPEQLLPDPNDPSEFYALISGSGSISVAPVIMHTDGTSMTPVSYIIEGPTLYGFDIDASQGVAYAAGIDGLNHSALYELALATDGGVWGTPELLDAGVASDKAIFDVAARAGIYAYLEETQTNALYLVRVHPGAATPVESQPLGGLPLNSTTFLGGPSWMTHAGRQVAVDGLGGVYAITTLGVYYWPPGP